MTAMREEPRNMKDLVAALSAARSFPTELVELRYAALPCDFTPPCSCEHRERAKNLRTCEGGE
eukprot:6366626-Amphidinium_carterae.1